MQMFKDGSRRRVAGTWVTAIAGLLATTAHAKGLQYFKNYFVTGDYLVNGVSLKDKGVNGIATGNIAVDGAQIPAGAEVVAAYLYWQTVGPSGGADASLLAGARFKKNDISGSAVLVNPAGSSPCWSNGGAVGSSGGARKIYSYRADVLRFFPRRETGTADARRIEIEVGGQHEVALPDAGNSNQIPSTLGAGLVLVYRLPGYDPATGFSQPNQPLRSIVIFDGGYTMDQQNPELNLLLEGFYEASRVAPNARMTHIVGNGQANFSERVRIQGTTNVADARLVATNPFVGAGGTSNQTGTGFDTVTFNNVPLDPGSMKARVIVDAGGSGSFDCLTWGAVVLSTEVQDFDRDGLLDVWEARSQWQSKPAAQRSLYASWPLATPTGESLPNLEAMGALPAVQDLFVEIDYMVGGNHSHLPAKVALDSVAIAFRRAPPRPSLPAGVCAANAAAGQCPINIHFDVGSNYQPPASVTAASCASATTWTPDCAIIRVAAGAKGGDPIPERSCAGLAECAFPQYPGTVVWKNGFRAYRDALVKATTREACTEGSAGCEPRFLQNRKDIFRYALFAHALGLPTAENPQQPRKTSGIADNNGGDLMVTLGLWDNQTGTPFVQGATLLHEIGHTLGLRHGGLAPIGSLLEPNCKPNYQSVMNYLFQVRGLMTADGTPVIDLSRQQLAALEETGLPESAGMGATQYLARWYAPRSNSFIDQALNTTPATRFCDGSPITNGSDYVRVDADPRVRNTATPNAVDWNADGSIAGTQRIDANFDGSVARLGPGSNDFVTMDLRQVGARRNIGSPSLSRSVVDPVTGLPVASTEAPIGGGLSLGMGYGDLGVADLAGYGDLGFGYGDLGFGYGDLGFGYGDLGFGYGDLGYGDLGYGIRGYGDLGVPAEEAVAGQPRRGEGDLDLDTAGSLGNAPNSLTAIALRRAAELRWSAPHVGTAVRYQVYRVTGASVTPANFAARLKVADLPAGFTSLVDSELKNNTTYTYFVVATLPDPNDPLNSTIQSGPSNFASVTP